MVIISDSFLFFFFSKHFCRNWFGKREAIFFLWYTEIHNCRNNSLSQNFFCNWSFCFAILFGAVFILEIFHLTRNISAEMCITERDYIGLVLFSSGFFCYLILNKVNFRSVKDCKFFSEILLLYKHISAEVWIYFLILLDLYLFFFYWWSRLRGIVWMRQIIIFHNNF